MNSLTQDVSKVNDIIKWATPIDATTSLKGIPDNVYPYNGLGGDQWAVVMNETQIAWARDYGIICLLYVTALQTQREHAERCPQDADDYGLQEPTL